MQLSNLRKTADMRGAYGEALVELGKENPNLVCVGADTTESLKTKKFGDKYPDRLFNLGIAEANLVSVAAGLAIAGKVVFASTYAAFLPGRCLDQIRNAVCYPNLSVKLVVSHAGLTVGADGASHQQNEDFSVMRAIPNMRVLSPGDAIAAKCLTKIVAKSKGPFYMRLARPSSEVLYTDEGAGFTLGKANILSEGNDATIIACGLMVKRSLEAAELLKDQEGISCRVVDMFCIKPIDQDMVYDAAKQTGVIVTAEEHNVIGGLGSAVTESCCERYPALVKRVGVQDTFGESARDDEIEDLLVKYGLTSSDIAKAVVESRRKGLA
jgi:transketolase